MAKTTSIRTARRQSMKEIQITRFMEGSTPVCSIPIGNSDRLVYMHLDDWYSLIGKGLDPRWTLSNGAILERGTRLSVTRLVAGCKKGQRVSLLDNNYCNLRRQNLLVGFGSGGKDPLDRLNNKEERPHRPTPVTIKYVDINPPQFKTITNMKAII